MTIERVAKAISEHMFPERTWSDDFDEYLLAKYRDCARAALDAIAEPTWQMIMLGKLECEAFELDKELRPELYPKSVMIARIWRAMYGAMLRETK